VVSHKTKRIKEPRRMIPGINIRRAARPRIRKRKRMVRPLVTMANVNSLARLVEGQLMQAVNIDLPWNPDP
jgi:hypothetical protein